MSNLVVSSAVDTLMQATNQAGIKSAVGLGNVDNVSSASAPVSTAQQAALDLKAALSQVVRNDASQTLTGTQKRQSRANSGQTMKDSISNILARYRAAKVDALMTSPPTQQIGVANANSVIITNAASGSPILLPDAVVVTPINCTTPTQSSGNYIPTYISGDLRTGGWGLRFGTDAQKVSVVVRDQSTLPVLLRVNGEWVSLSSQTLVTSGGTNFYELTYDFTTSAPRVLEWFVNSAVQIRGFNYGASAGTTAALNPYRAWKVQLPNEPKVLVRTDSYGEIPNLRSHFVAQLGEMLGCMGTVSSAASAQGYVAVATSNSHAALADIADISLFGALDLLIVALGYNDNGLSGVQAAAQAYLTAAMAAQPSAVIVVVCPWNTPSHGAATANTNIKAAFTAVADPARMFLIDTISATPTYQDSSGLNASLYISGDNVHPNAAGGKYLAARIASDLVTGLNALLAAQ